MPRLIFGDMFFAVGHSLHCENKVINTVFAVASAVTFIEIIIMKIYYSYIIKPILK